VGSKNRRQQDFEGEPYAKNNQLIQDDFGPQSRHNWLVEAEEQLNLQDMLVDGNMEIDVSKGATVWHKNKLGGNVLIEYEATVVDEGGENDRSSDFNCFWMASDPNNPEDFFANSDWRGGIFWNYYILNLYYVGLGGHDNTKTRFRKYNGSADPQPKVIREYSQTPYLIEANKKNKVQIIHFDGLIQYFFNGIKLFELEEEKPYSEGYFGFRTVNNHMRIHSFKVFSLKAK